MASSKSSRTGGNHGRRSCSAPPVESWLLPVLACTASQSGCLLILDTPNAGSRSHSGLLVQFAARPNIFSVISCHQTSISPCLYGKRSAMAEDRLRTTFRAVPRVATEIEGRLQVPWLGRLAGTAGDQPGIRLLSALEDTCPPLRGRSCPERVRLRTAIRHSMRMLASPVTLDREVRVPVVQLRGSPPGSSPGGLIPADFVGRKLAGAWWGCHGRPRGRSELIAERLAAAAAGRGVVVLLGGEPGIGKTVLGSGGNRPGAVSAAW